jgi:hypothetical protein
LLLIIISIRLLQLALLLYLLLLLESLFGKHLLLLDGEENGVRFDLFRVILAYARLLHFAKFLGPGVRALCQVARWKRKGKIK